MKKTNTPKISKPKQNIIRVNVTIIEPRARNEARVKWTDVNGMEHLTPWKTEGRALQAMKEYIQRITGIGRVSLIIAGRELKG